MPTRFDVERASFSNGLPANHKLVLAVLGHWSDAETAAIPPQHRKSLAEIAAACSLHVTTIKRVLNDLEEQGWLQRRRPTQEQQRSGMKTGYRLLIPAGHEVGAVRATGRLSQSQAPPAETLFGGSVSAGGRRPESQKRSQTSSTGKTVVAVKDSRSASLTESDGFAEFWSVYPRKVGKKAAAKAYAKAVREGAGVAQILAGARRYGELAFGSDHRFVAHPTSWLNQGRWDDDPAASAATFRRSKKPATAAEGISELMDHARRLAEEGR